MDIIQADQFGVTERVKCTCGSEIMLKNMRQHEKTQKHINGGVITRKKREPAQLEIGETCLGTTKFTKIQKTQPTPEPEEEDEHEDKTENNEFEDIVLDDIQTISDKLDQVLDLLNAGFSAILGAGEQLESIPESDEEEKESELEPIPEVVKEPIKEVPKPPKTVKAKKVPKAP